MKHLPVTSQPQLISMRCLLSGRGSHCDWHAHPFEEFTLVTDDTTLNGFAGGKVRTGQDTLFLFRPGERHGYWNDARQAPRFWVVHFAARPELRRRAACLAERDPRRRIWKLSADRAATFKWIFLRLFEEHSRPRPQRELAEAAWLQLLLVSLERWTLGEDARALTPAPADPELLRLWHVVNECIGQPVEFAARIRELRNYDSLRHRFKKTFACSPGQMVLRLRMQQAKNLLLETPLNIKEIAHRLGYLRQHEFARAFRRQTGVTPSQWRASPLPGALESKPAK